MTGDDDEWAFFHRERHGGRHRVAVGLRVGPVQERHTFQIDFPDFQDQGKKLLHIVVLAHSGQSLIEKCVDFIIGISENHGMIRVCRHAAQSK